MKKKLMFLLMALMMVAVLVVGCSSGGNSDSGGSDNAAKPADEKTYTVKVGYENHPGEPVDLAVNEWKRLAEERSNGKLIIEIYPSSQLGSKVDAIEQMQLGTNIIYIADAGFLMDYVPDLGILSGPYLVESFDDLFKVLDSDWFAQKEQELQQKGINIVSAKWIYGDRHMIATKPVIKPADMKGLKIRVPNSRIQIAAIEAMGATPTPMPLGDVYPAMAQGVVDGAENPLPVIYGAKQHEVAKNISLTGHIKMIVTWLAGQKYIDTLPADIQTILKETADEAGLFNNNIVKEKDQETIDQFRAEGATVHEEVDVAAFKEAVQDVYTQFPEWTPGLYETIQEIVK
ncbi:MAG: C4-dicarboxylate TRAP transporter substrate-binding protein [Bacillota bacterium]|nr:C4-dicarboxylate TRAP transporter substrate-binding protein [Bacillota bacterium]